MEKKKILLIDGNSLFFKSFYGTYFRLKQGYERGENNEPVNALRLFALMMINLRRKFNDYKIVVAFDEQGSQTYRHEYDFYKANRTTQPQELYDQIDFVKNFLKLYGIKWVSSKKYEADDLIGIIATKAKKENYLINIFTSDKDLLQLVDENITVSISKTGVSDIEEFNNNNFYDKFYNLSPMQIPDLKGIAGDSSDNLKGINGIGEKGAIKLLKKYDSLENIIENIDEITESLKLKIENGKEMGLLSKKLAKIITEGEYKPDFNEYVVKHPMNEELTKFLTEKKLFNVINQLKKK